MDILNFGAPPGHPLRQPILDMIWHKYRTTPRHTQIELGPSEIGEECVRRLAYNALHHKPLHTNSDPLPSIVGTAAHTWLEAACREWNEHAGELTWIVEQTIRLTDGIIGHCDAYHIPTRSVVDWKFPGQEPMARYRRDGPSALYQRQGHLYGRAWAQMGVPVDEVVIVFFPRGGNLSGMHIWSEKYSPQIADEALSRYRTVTELAITLNVTEHPDRYRLFPVDPGHHCTHCLWFKPGPDTGDGCPGYTKNKEKS